MNRPEETIERVLGALRNAEVPEGLEQRVLRAIAEDAEHRGRPSARRRRWTPAMSWMACGGVALAIVAVVTIAARHRVTPAPHARLQGAQATQSAVAQVVVTSPSSGTRLARSVPLPRRRAEAGRASPARLRFAADFPAPPMPLTEQEKLLLRVARRGQPEPAARLDPDELARGEAKAEAAFQASLGKFPETAAPHVEPRLPESGRKGESQ